MESHKTAGKAPKEHDKNVTKNKYNELRKKKKKEALTAADLRRKKDRGDMITTYYKLLRGHNTIIIKQSSKDRRESRSNTIIGSLAREVSRGARGRFLQIQSCGY